MPHNTITAWPARELSRAIHARRVGCVEVMEAFLAQAERLNPTFNALVSGVHREALLQQAVQRDQELSGGMSRGWMRGFPHAPKDVTSVAGLPTTQGSPIFKSHVPDSDSIVVERMRQAGAIFIGRTNVSEFALGSHTYNPVFGTTLNAFDKNLSAGGSSGGAAVALALRMVPLADGNDMMGSLRNPAGWNNVVGFRPSYGRVPVWPVKDLFLQQLACEGPMARTVGDAAALLATMAGHDTRVPFSIKEDPGPFRQSLDWEHKGARIGWLGDLDGYLATEAGLIDTCAAALKHFESIGCVVEPVRVDFPMAQLWRAWLVFRGLLSGNVLAPLQADASCRALMKAEALWEVEAARGYTAADVYEASVVRTAWYRTLGTLFERYDFLVLPSAQVFSFNAQQAWPQDIAGRAMDTYHRWMEVTIHGTLGGGPVLSVPGGFSANGLPIGLQILGRAQADLAVLRIGHAYEQASGFSAIRSPALT